MTPLVKKLLRSPVTGFVLLALAAALVIVAADRVIFGGEDAAFADRAAGHEPPTLVVPDNGRDYFESTVVGSPPDKAVAKMPKPEPQTQAAVPELPPVDPEKQAVVETPVEPVPAAPQAAPVIVPPQTGAVPKIAIIIDDIGMDVKRSREAIEDLPPTVTLAVLPYAPEARKMAAAGRAKGHPVIIHVPMEAVDKNANIGPGGLKEGMSDVDFTASFQKMLVGLDGYEGINNHMGSRLTQDRQAMDRIAVMLKARGLYFIDSMTIASSIAAKEAAANGVPFARRDVFLDHQDTPEFVAGALAKTESIARKKGYAVAIGHPKDHTLAALEAWIPTLAAKGIALVPVKSLLTVPRAPGE